MSRFTDENVKPEVPGVEHLDPPEYRLPVFGEWFISERGYPAYHGSPDVSAMCSRWIVRPLAESRAQSETIEALKRVRMTGYPYSVDGMSELAAALIETGSEHDSAMHEHAGLVILRAVDRIQQLAEVLKNCQES